MPMQQILIGAMVLDGVIGVLLFALYYAAWTSRLQANSSARSNSAPSPHSPR
jgi:hypothetical protein